MRKHRLWFSIFFISSFVAVGCIFENQSIKQVEAVEELPIETPIPVVLPVADTIVNVFDTIRIVLEDSAGDGSELQYIWKITETGSIDTLSRTARKLVFSDTGIYPISVTGLNEAGELSEPVEFIVKVVSEAPVMEAVADTSIGVFDTLLMEVSGTSRYDIPLRYIWDMGIWGGSDTLASRTHKFVFSDTGVFPVRVAAIDSFGSASEPDSFSITVTSPRPIFRIVDDSVLSVFVFDTIRVGVSGESRNNVPLRYLWEMDGQVFVDTVETDYRDFVFSDTGSFHGTVTALDTFGTASEPVGFIITVVSVQPEIFGLSDTSLSINDSIYLRIRTTGAEKTPLRYVWKAEWLSDADTSRSADWSSVVTETGVFEVEVTAFDDFGMASNPVRIEVAVTNHPPVLNLLASAASYLETDTIRLIAEAADDDGRVTEYHWSLDGTSFVKTPDSTYWFFASLVDWDGTVYGKVMDEDGNFSEISSLVVAVASVPVIVAVSDTFGIVGDSITLFVKTHVSTGSLSQYEWAVNYSPSQVYSPDTANRYRTSEPKFSTSWNDEGPKTIMVRAYDDDGHASEWKMIQVWVYGSAGIFINAEYSITPLRGSGYLTVQRTDSVVVRVEVVGDIHQFTEFYWYLDGDDIWDLAFSNLSESRRVISNPGGGYSLLRAGAKDIYDSIHMAEVFVLFNSPPVLEFYSMTWQGFDWYTNKGTVAVSFVCQDPDAGDFNWSIPTDQRLETLYWGQAGFQLMPVIQTGHDVTRNIAWGSDKIEDYYTGRVYNVRPDVEYNWKNVCTDLYGMSDTLENTFIRSVKPGEIWQKVDSNRVFPGRGVVLGGKEKVIQLGRGPGDNTIYESEDGIDWNAVGQHNLQTMDSSTIAAGAMIGNEYIVGIAVGNQVELFLSRDLSEWKTIGSGIKLAGDSLRNISLVPYMEQIWLFIHYKQGADIFSSVDGVEWAPQSSNVNFGYEVGSGMMGYYQGKLWHLGFEYSHKSANIQWPAWYEISIMHIHTSDDSLHWEEQKFETANITPYTWIKAEALLPLNGHLWLYTSDNSSKSGTAYITGR